MASSPSRKTLDERFQRLGDGLYRLDAGDDHGTSLELRHVRRERYQLVGELTVQTDHLHARGRHGVLMVVAANLSTSRGLDEIATAIDRQIDGKNLAFWQGVAHDLGTGVALAERTGEPSARLSGLTRPSAERNGFYRVHGFQLPQKLPAMFFGKGDVLKTFTATAVGVGLDRLGISTLIVDGEMRFDDLDERTGMVTGGTPTNFLRRIGCARPLIYELDRITETVREFGIQYVIFDSVAFLVHDKPESSESALRYFQAVRSLGEIGSLHLAHRAKHEDGDKMPFGSAFWYNAVRALWYAERAESTDEHAPVDVAFLPRKFNCGSFPAPHGLRFTFTDDAVTLLPVNPATVPALAKGLSIQRRILELLRTGPMDPEALTEALDEKADTVARILRRFGKPDSDKQMFVRLADGRYANCEKRYA